jgi:Arm DNA-binding domain
MTKLTKRFVDTAVRGSSQDSILWDDELKGFGLRLRGNSKTYVVQYKFGGRGGQNRRVLLGKTTVLTPEQARDRAKKILAVVADGRDPVEEKRAKERAKMTVAELADLYLVDGPAEKPNKKPSSCKLIARILNGT